MSDNNKHNITVGQTVWVARILMTGGFGEEYDDKKRECVVTEVNDEYFNIDGLVFKFFLSDLRNMGFYLPTYKCFLTENGANDANKSVEMRRSIARRMRANTNISLEDLNQIHKLIGENDV